MKVYLAMKHPRYPFGFDIKWLDAATVEGVFIDRDDAAELVAKENAKNSTHYRWSVQAKVVKGG